MRFPFVSRSRHQDLQERYEDLYGRYQLALKAAAKAREKADTAHFNRQQVLVQNASLDAANRRLEGRALELGRRLSALAESDPEYAVQLERRIARLRTVGRRILAAYGGEVKRATRLQAQLDDAVGLTPRGIKDSSQFQPGYKKPKPKADAS